MDCGGDGWVDSRPGLYVHIPFCSAICPYCDFAVVRSGHPLRERFIEDLAREIETLGKDTATAHPWRFTQRFDGQEFGTVYLGGGTPTALGATGLAELCETLNASVAIAEDAVWSIEANPEDVSRQALRDWVELGFSYLSLGVQSFDEATLAFLGRRHSVDEGIHACELASESDFSTVSLDLMYGMECLEQEAWTRVLTTATSFSVGHLSCYELTIHEGTAFWRRQQEGELPVANERHRATQFRETHETLAETGYFAYEVSNFARLPADRSPHNQKYWRSLPYLGIGPSAHSYDGDRRWWNQRSLRVWSDELRCGRISVAEVETLSPKQKRIEWLLTRLRTTAGGDLLEYRRLFGRDLAESREEALASLQERGLVSVEGPLLRPTAEGLLLADSLVMALVD